MAFLLSPELSEFQTGLRGLLAERLNVVALRKAIESNTSTESWAADALWKELAALGVFMAPLSEADGGLGFGVSAASVVCEEIGATLTRLPITETLVGGVFPLMYAEECEARTKLLGQLSAGELSIACAVDPALSTVEPDGVQQIVFSGYCPTAPIAIILGADGSPAKLLIQEASEATYVPLLDLIRTGATVRLGGNPRYSMPISQGALLRPIAQVLVVSEMLGAARALLRMTVDYVKTRKQFGAPIGSFQAIQHKLADMVSAVESVSALTRFAAWSIDSTAEGSVRTALSLKAHASHVLPKVAEDALQAHGGIGFTFEYDLHLYLRRIVTLASWFGSASSLTEELGQSVVEGGLS